MRERLYCSECGKEPAQYKYTANRFGMFSCGKCGKGCPDCDTCDCPKRKRKPADYTALVSELGEILRGMHPAWGGDRRTNGYVFLRRIADDMPEHAIAMALDIERNVEGYSECSGVSPNTLRQAAKVLVGKGVTL